MLSVLSLSAINQAKENIMRTKSKIFIPLLFTILVLFVTACGPSGTPDAVATFNPMVTAAAQTMEALLTQAANPSGAQPTATQSSGAVLLPTITTAPTSTSFVLPVNTQIPPAPTAITRCDWVSFVSDVTVPDGTKYTPGSSFVKTWRLKNIGTCTWTSSYSLVYVSGDQMGGSAAIALPGNVAPNQTVDVSVTLTAPTTEKAYSGNWMLRNASGTVFGIGPTATSSFWVKITVAEPTVATIAYDFVANYNLATWECAAGPTACTVGATSDPLGYVMKLNAPQLENNTTGTEAALLTHPQNVNDGYITGAYPAFDVKSGDRFQAKIGCQYGSTVCFVRFRLDYQVGADPVKNLGQWDEKYDNQYSSVNVDLSSLAGKSVVFFLKVQTLGSPLQDDALWSAARITRTTPVSTGSCVLVSQTPANNTSFAANYDFDTVWTIKNTSTYDWLKTSVDFVYVNGTKMHKPSYGDVRDLPLDVVKNGTLALTVDMLAPASSGTYSETWALKDGSNTICTMSVTIKVKP